LILGFEHFTKTYRIEVIGVVTYELLLLELGSVRK